MSRAKKLKLFAKAILMDIVDSNIEVQMLKHSNALIKTNTIKTTLCSLLEGDEKLNKMNDEWINKYTDIDFYFHFHMQKSSFYTLLREIDTSENLHEDLCQANTLTIERCLLITLWFLAKGVPYTNVSAQFSLSVETISQIVESFIKLLVSLQYKYIIWPSKNECEDTSKTFYEAFKYPDVIGVIGSTHVNIIPPIQNEVIYRNPNLEYSVILQAVCNSKKEFINMYAGFPGSISNSVALKHSLYQDIEESNSATYFYNKYHLIGDHTYPLRSWLMCPYKKADVLTYEHMKHNKALRDALSVIEDAFHIVKDRWKILSFVYVTDFDKISETIEACCVLHNFCLKNEDIFDSNLCWDEEETKMGYLPNSVKGISKRDCYLNKYYKN